MERQTQTGLIKRAASSKRVGELFKRAWRAVEPGERAWKGATLGLLVGALLVGLPFFYTGFLIRPRGVTFVVGSVASLIVISAIAGLLALLVVLLKSIPTFYLWALAGAFMLLNVSFGPDTPGGTSAAVAVIVVSSLLGGAVWVLVRGGWKDSSAVQRVITVTGLLLGLVGLGAGGRWLVCDGPAIESPPNAAAQSAAQVAPLAISAPSQPGVYEPQLLFYGSGVDRQRPEYGPSVKLVTIAVDGSPFVDGWQRGSLRSNYWGFGPDELPLNARVWYPAGAGPFPLVLMVHGNHEAEDFSDPGYDYLGQLLASRGFIFVSVDENFLNTSFSADLLGGGLKDEIDARAWLLLEHVRVWDEWNKTPGNPFYQVVDMDNIAFIGHSRGGAAAAGAAAFNQLPFYPDDATVAFDYRFGIRSVVAIAPVDAVYEPTVSYYEPGGRRLSLENVNYLALHGSSDMQVWSFVGLSQYKRVTFTDNEYWFKATLYIYGANHGQFNTTWGRSDYREPKIRLFDLRSVMSAQEQKQIAQVYVTAFLEATLRGESGYIPLFRDYRVASNWLPDTIYLNLFQDSTYQLVSTCEEDINVTTTTLPGGAQLGQNLTVWREQLVELEWGDTRYPIDTSAVFLGWDTEAGGSPANYTITLPDKGLALNADSVLVFALADAQDPNMNTKNEQKARSGPLQPIDLTVQVTDGAGETAQLPLSSYAFLQPQIDRHIVKNSAPFSEIVFQSFELSLAAFVEINPAFDPASLTSVRFIFDRTPAGIIVLDDLGFRD